MYAFRLGRRLLTGVLVFIGPCHLLRPGEPYFPRSRRRLRGECPHLWTRWTARWLLYGLRFAPGYREWQGTTAEWWYGRPFFPTPGRDPWALARTLCRDVGRVCLRRPGFTSSGRGNPIFLTLFVVLRALGVEVPVASKPPEMLASLRREMVASERRKRLSAKRCWCRGAKKC